MHVRNGQYCDASNQNCLSLQSMTNSLKFPKALIINYLMLENVYITYVLINIYTYLESFILIKTCFWNYPF